ncbi:MAG: hypothetical protein KDE63_13190, partial [Novosphingobium sp.]|nr:hypothetical protein [Novosphingobium sp.]
MIKKSIAVAIATCLFLQPAAVFAKKKPELSSLEIQQMQSRDIEGDKDTVFGAVMTVLQDAGYRIEAAGKDTGLITGIGSSKGKLTYNLFLGFGRSKKTPVVSAFIESYSPEMTRVRLNFVMAKVKSSLYGSQPQDEEPVYDAQVYRDAFEKINQNVFLRQSLAATAAPSAPVAKDEPTPQPPADGPE